VPSGTIPKDGPFTGLTVAVALISFETDWSCKRNVALSGKLSLRGRILPVRGVKEKLLAAHGIGVKYVVFSVKNQADIKDISVIVKLP